MSLIAKVLGAAGTILGGIWVVVKYTIKFRTVDSELRMVEHCEQNRRRTKATLDEIANKAYSTGRRLDAHIEIDHVMLDKRVTDLEHTMKRFIG